MSSEAALIKRPYGPPRWRSLIEWLNLRGDRCSSLKELHDLYGPLTVSYFMHLGIYFIATPAGVQECLVSRHKDFRKSRAYFGLRLLLGDGLITQENDDAHLRQRRMIQPAFHRERTRDYGKAMVEFAVQSRDAMAEGQRFDMNREMMHVALHIVAKALFSNDVSKDAARVGHALDTLMHMDAIFTSPMGPFISKLPISLNRTRLKMTAELDEVIYRMIRERRESGDKGDLLSMLLAARDEEDGTAMTDQQVRDEAITIFLAGHETTANALTWTWYLLSQHPEIEAKFHEELERVLAGRTPTPDDYPALTYTKQVFAEAMRLYPPVWAMAREAVCDTQLDGIFLPKGAQIVLSTYATHRDPNNYPNPDVFDPERFTPEAIAARPKFAYFPFGGGRRLCMGEGFAWMEGVLVLATLGQRWKFRHDPAHKAALDPHITLRPKGGMPMFAHAR